MIDSLSFSFCNSSQKQSEVSEAPESVESPTEPEIQLILARHQIQQLKQNVAELKSSRRSMQKRIYALEATLRKTSIKNNTENADNRQVE